jgi:protoporphyrinogen/coproporphyrinogen III oxidase
LAADGGGTWAVRLTGGRVVVADAVVVASPAASASQLLAGVSAGVAAELAAIGTASVALTLLAYPDRALAAPPRGSGFLVPRSEGRLLTAASWVGTKWPHLATPGLLVVRASAGRVDDPRAQQMDDEELTGAIHRELASAMGLTAAPVDARVYRYPQAFPQYEVGHLERIARAEATLAVDAPGVVLAGAALRGVGLATCIAGARQAADAAAAACAL